MNEFDALAHEELLELERTRHEYNPDGIKAIDRAGALLHGQGTNALAQNSHLAQHSMEEVLVPAASNPQLTANVQARGKWASEHKPSLRSDAPFPPMGGPIYQQ